MLKVLARLNCSRQHLSLLMGEDRGGNQDATAGVSVEELRDGRDRMEQAADGSSSTATVMAGLQMVAFDGSDVVLFKKRVGRGASDRAQPAKNERRRRFEFTGEVATSVPADGCGRARRGAWAFLGISGSGEGGQRLPAGSLVDADGVELRTGEAVALASSGTNGRRRSSGFGSSAPGGAAESLASGRRSAWRSKAPVTNYSDVAR
jgi:hypothetical protein